MRIVFVGPFALQPKRTMAVRALPLAKAMAAIGHEVVVVMPPWDDPGESGHKWTEGSVSIHNVALPPAIPLLFHVWLTWRLLASAVRLRPDVVHCFKPKGYSGLVAWALWQARRLGLLTCQIVVDADDWEGHGGWNEIGGYSWTQRRVFSWQERWGLTHCDAVTVASKALQTIVWSLGVPPCRVSYVPNGALPSAVASTTEVEVLRAKLGLGSGPVALLYTRFFEFNLARAVDTMAQVVAGEPATRWLVVGKGLFGEDDAFARLVAQKGLSHCVTLTGWIPTPELPLYWALADAAAVPFDDTLVNRCKCSVKLCDLMLAGVPVVAEAVGQNGEYVQHGVSGLLVPTGAADLFSAAVLRLLRDKELARTLAQAAVQRMRQCFDWPILANGVLDAYRRPAQEGQAVGNPSCPPAKPQAAGERLLRTAWVLCWYWLPPLALMAFIFRLSSSPTLPSLPGTWLDAVLKKMSHVLIFFLLFVLALRALRHSQPLGKALPGALLWVALYAISDEVHQKFVPGRHANWYDVAFDLSGGVLFSGLTASIRHYICAQDRDGQDR
jgi:glycosyltransferase involved in cell wall biosynthesis/VanZ family protein